MRVDAFRPTDHFLQDMDKWIRRFRSAEAVEGKQVLIPGDPERLLEIERRRDGIPLLEPVVADLKALATRFQLDFKLD
jgi:LDH2 family malate/lactate/ureidoglycolate dehydrogenase